MRSKGYKRQRSEKPSETALSDSSDSDIVITTSLAKKKEKQEKEAGVSAPHPIPTKKIGKEDIEPKENLEPKQEGNLSTQELVQILKTRLDKSSGYKPDPSKLPKPPEEEFVIPEQLKAKLPKKGNGTNPLLIEERVGINISPEEALKSQKATYHKMLARMCGRLYSQSWFLIGMEVAVSRSKPCVRRLLVGLGNMGSEFHRTRHNVGFAVCKTFASEYLPNMNSDDIEWKWRVAKSSKCSLLQTTIHFSQKSSLGLDLVDHVSDRACQKTLTNGVPFPNIQLSLSLPLTYMNNSGQSVMLFSKQNNFRLKAPSAKNNMDEILIIHDDISIPFGEIRFSPKGGSGGQNGVKSIIKCMATEKIPRLRVGIGSSAGEGPMRADARYVIGRWDCIQLNILPYVIHFACEGLRVYLHRGINAAASCCNFKNCVEAYKAVHPDCDSGRMSRFEHFEVDDIVNKN